MRPIRLEIEGFTSFRDRTVVDFEDTDLFVLTGPTGAGKSSVIDAISFVLYGSIPRLNDRRAVAPVISRGLLQARVRLHFAVGKDRYTAVRVARTTKSGGATTPEARLEDQSGNTLAGSAKELSDNVAEVLGLPFEHFTKSVVLPQGDFARLLHETPSNRQDLLVRLLGTELYERIAQRAGQRARENKVIADNLERDIKNQEAKGITADGLKAARQRAEDLDNLVRSVQGRQTEIEDLREKARSAKEKAEDIEERLNLLKAVCIPESVPKLAMKITEVRRNLKDVRETHREVAEERQRRQDKLDKLPKEAELRVYLSRYDDLAKARKERDKAASDLEVAQTRWEAAEDDAKQMREAFEAAEFARKSMEDRHRAYHLASGLTAGDFCPVCLQHVGGPPDLDPPEEMEKVETALRKAQKHRKSADKQLENARSDAAAKAQSLKDSEVRVESLHSDLKNADAREVVKSALEQVEMAAEALQEANCKETQASDELEEAQKAVNALEGDEKRGWQDYDTQRDLLADMQPPVAEREDLAASWNDLASWSREKAKEQHVLHDEAKEARQSSQSALDDLRQAIVDWCRDANVVIDDGEPLAACRYEQGRQAGEVKRIDQGLKELKQRKSELKLHRKEGQAADDLARHLNASNFERWLMAQVLEQLCLGASKELSKLSGDSYSLDLDDRNNFVVVDHHNADERRPVRTLSGGETFLASLSLALALSEHLVDLAVGGAAKLEALFLDEGFGALDSDTLDVVINAIEELGSRGRMVGVVTHVKELSESIPVRYEVTKEGNRSSIQRVEA